MNKLEFTAVVKQVQSYASTVGDKTYTVTLKGEDERMAQAIAMPGDKVMKVTIEFE